MLSILPSQSLLEAILSKPPDEKHWPSLIRHNGSETSVSAIYAQEARQSAFQSQCQQKCRCTSKSPLYACSYLSDSGRYSLTLHFSFKSGHLSEKTSWASLRMFSVMKEASMREGKLKKGRITAEDIRKATEVSGASRIRASC